MASDQTLLISIRPPFASSILAGSKTVELRRVKPRVQPGDLVVIYASGAIKGIVGAFEVIGVTAESPDSIWKQHGEQSGLTRIEFDDYYSGTTRGYAIRIGRTWELPNVITLATLRSRSAGFRPPQSYHYWNFKDLHGISGQDFAKISATPSAAEKPTVQVADSHQRKVVAQEKRLGIGPARNRGKAGLSFSEALFKAAG